MLEARPQGQESSLPDFKRILVAVDGSDNSLRATRMAVNLAGKYGSELMILHVISRPSYGMALSATGNPPSPVALENAGEYEKKIAKTFVGRASVLAKGSGVEVRTEIQVSAGSIVEGITEYAEGEKVDLIVIGTRGLSRFKKLILGSISSGVVNHAHCPVLVVR